jgi:hypothetical protein
MTIAAKTDVTNTRITHLPKPGQCFPVIRITRGDIDVDQTGKRPRD